METIKTHARVGKESMRINPHANHDTSNKFDQENTSIASLFFAIYTIIG